jgi:UPF0755 protein
MHSPTASATTRWRDRTTEMTDEILEKPPRVRPTRSSARPSRKAMLAAGGFVVIVLAALAVAYYTWWNTDSAPLVHVAAGQPVTVTVPKGASTAEIGQILAENGIVANARQFRARVRDAGVGEKLLAGTYDLRTGMGYEAAIASLTAGPTQVFTKVTIPEGFTVEQIAARLEKQARIPSAAFLELAKGHAADFAADHPYLAEAYDGSLEGFLFPKTYQVKKDATAKDVIEMMLAQFDREMAGVDRSKATARGLDLYQVVVLASLVEREAKLAKERPLVSSVIYNRLRLNMRLGIDATIEYVLKANRLRLTNEDLQTESPYNTYLHAGLPPGPIACPGLASLRAAASPADTKYLYYVLTGTDGSHTFAKTYAEFERAKAKSKEVFGK